MSRTVCLDPQRALHDRRFRRKLSGWEFRDFLFLLCFAADECRDPAFIPARKVSDLAMELGMTGKDGRMKFSQRLDKWSSSGIELIQIEEDGGIQINYVLDQEEEERDAEYPAAYSLSSGNGNGNNGSGSNGSSNGHALVSPVSANSLPAKRPRKNASRNPDADRKREKYWRDKAAQNGSIYMPAGDQAPGDLDDAPENLAEDFDKNLRADESKPPVNTGESGGKNLQNLPEDFTAPRGRVGSRIESGELDNKVISSSEFEFDANLRTGEKTSGQNLRPKPPGHTSSPFLHLPPDVARIRCNDAVNAVMAFTEDGKDLRKVWRKMWTICHESGQLPLWDEAIRRVAKEIKSGHKPVTKKGNYLVVTLKSLLQEQQVFVPTQAELEESSPEEVRAIMQRSLAEAESLAEAASLTEAGEPPRPVHGLAQSEPSRSSAIVPLDHIYGKSGDLRQETADV